MGANCPICETSCPINSPYINCPRCGNICILGSRAAVAMAHLPQKLGDWDDVSVHRRSRLSYLLRRMQRDGQMAGLLVNELESWRLDDPLPSPAEQLDELIIWLGDHQSDPAASVAIPVPEVEAWIGARIKRNRPSDGLSWLIAQRETEVLIDTRSPLGTIRLHLTMPGWERYHALKRGRVESRKAFMAMKFGVPELDQVYNECFRPAVARTGFELFDLRDQQRAGMIDDHMRVAIRNSRFIIADLSYGCRGSYWEGGFAEGLGRPVIYTCEATKWADEKPHFDTNHLTTVIWDLENFGEAAQQLTAIIRNTLPEEARMED